MTKLIMKNYNTILTEKQHKYQHYLTGKIDNHEQLAGEEMLPYNQSRITEHATFRYSPLHKAFEKQIKNLRSRKKTS